MSENNYDSRTAYNARRRKRRRKIIRKRITLFILSVVVIVGVIFGGKYVWKLLGIKEPAGLTASENTELLKNIQIPEWVDTQLIHVHNTARTGTAVSEIKNIVIHYVGNPGTTAQNNRDYFDKEDTEVSSHFLVGLDGEIIQCVPLWEKSAASNWRNKDTVSIEVCHPDESGKFSDAAYDSVIKLTAWICNELKLDENDVIRHYDITEKMCPLYYVEHEDAWKQLKKDVGTKLNEYR